MLQAGWQLRGRFLVSGQAAVRALDHPAEHPLRVELGQQRLHGTLRGGEQCARRRRRVPGEPAVRERLLVRARVRAG